MRSAWYMVLFVHTPDIGKHTDGLHLRIYQDDPRIGRA
jgi:hypothetical protein